MVQDCLALEPAGVSAGVDTLGRLCLYLEGLTQPVAVVLCPLEDAHHIEYMIRATAAVYTVPDDASEIATTTPAAPGMPTPRDVFGGERA
ncbi:hypothetical protein [Actinomyces faecalis]|uniref:hypothetical protein n=1 Tax=Actinomyces faecalis TaxID=2722820 RepID=UPI001C555320|nr:hypothetical protein [Actinomyces faecalis]